VYARARPGYDPYGWLVWGKLAIHLKLDTNGAPSWKPLPFLFTVPYAVVGHYALWLWMVTSVAISLSGLIFAWRIAFRLTYSRPERRYASYVAGLFAAAFVLGMQDPIAPASYVHYLLSAESDTMIVALCLAAIDFHLEEHHRWAFWMWFLAGLGRPEVWPFLGLAGLWLWWKDPSYRRWLYGALGLLIVFWFVIPGISSKSFFTAGNIAQNSPRAVHGNKVTGTIRRFHQLEANPVWIMAALTVAWAVWRRRIAILVLAAGALLWLVIEIAFALKGYPAVPRYMFEAGAVVGILAAVDRRGPDIHSAGDRGGHVGDGSGRRPGRRLDVRRRPSPNPARASRFAPRAGAHGPHRSPVTRGQHPGSKEHIRLRTAQHPDRVPEHLRLVRGGQDGRVVRQPRLPASSPAPAGQHLPDRGPRLEGVPQPRGPGSRRRLQADGPRLPVTACRRGGTCARGPRPSAGGV